MKAISCRLRKFKKIIAWKQRGDGNRFWEEQIGRSTAKSLSLTMHSKCRSNEEFRVIGWGLGKMDWEEVLWWSRCGMHGNGAISGVFRSVWAHFL